MKDSALKRRIMEALEPMRISAEEILRELKALKALMNKEEEKE